MSPTRGVVSLLSLATWSACTPVAVHDAGEAGADAGRAHASGLDVALGAPDASEPSPDASAPISRWRSEPPLPVPLQEISAITLDERIWVVGGFEPGGDVGTVRVLDPTTGAWSLGPSLPRPRHHVALAEVGGDLYVLGGMETSRFTHVDDAYVLRRGADAWSPIARLPEERAAAIAGVVGGRIHVVGGQGRGGLARTTLTYDPVSDAWSIGASIPTPREHLAGFVYDAELWAVGGRRLSLSSNLDVVEIYDPATDAWRSGPSLVLPRGGFAAAVLDGVAYAVGGEQPDRALDEAEALALPAGTWTEIERVPTPRHGHAMAAAAGRVWIIGGADAPIFSAVPAVESLAP